MPRAKGSKNKATIAREEEMSRFLAWKAGQTESPAPEPDQSEPPGPHDSSASSPSIEQAISEAEAEAEADQSNPPGSAASVDVAPVETAVSNPNLDDEPELDLSPPVKKPKKAKPVFTGRNESTPKPPKSLDNTATRKHHPPSVVKDSRKANSPSLSRARPLGGVFRR